VRIDLTDRVAPADVRALVVFADSKTHTLGVFMANLGIDSDASPRQRFRGMIQREKNE
jgi:hypothetical protein